MTSAQVLLIGCVSATLTEGVGSKTTKYFEDFICERSLLTPSEQEMEGRMNLRFEISLPRRAEEGRKEVSFKILCPASSLSGGEAENIEWLLLGRKGLK